MKGWQPASRENHCPICGGPDNCTISTNGRHVYCGRVSEGSIRQNDGGQWLHILDAGFPQNDWLRSNPRRKTSVIAVEPGSTQDWELNARIAFESPNAHLHRARLANELGVSVDSLRRIGVGWSDRDHCWTMPERDAAGKVIGINRRLLNGDKRRQTNSKSGLTYDPIGWLENDGDVADLFLVEGASDVAAMLTLGMSAVGRPSNCGGISLLGELLKKVSIRQQIVVVGEWDRRAHESLKPAARARHDPDCQKCATCWPGWYGAVMTAKRLSQILHRKIIWTLAPEGFKDIREWLNGPLVEELVS